MTVVHRSWSPQSRRVFQSAVLGARLRAYPASNWREKCGPNLWKTCSCLCGATAPHPRWGGACRWLAARANSQQITQALTRLDQSGGAFSSALQQLGARGSGHGEAQATQARESLVLPGAKTGAQGKQLASYQAAPDWLHHRSFCRITYITKIKRTIL